MTLYLCGPINGCTDEECKDWRAYVRQHWVGDVLDPMCRDYRGREDDCVSEIVEGDKADIDHADALIVNYDKPSVGTAMEVLYAWERGKPIVVVAAEGVSISPWLRYHASVIVGTFEGALNALAR